MFSILIILYSFLFPQTRSEFGAEVNVFTALDVRPGTFRYFHSPGMNFHPCLATGDWTLQTRGDWRWWTGKIILDIAAWALMGMDLYLS